MLIPLHSRLNQLSSRMTKTKQADAKNGRHKCAGRDAEQLEISCLLTGMLTGTNTQENTLAVSYTFKHIPTI